VRIPDAQTEKGVQAEEEILCITSGIRERVIDAAMREGFDLAGIASVPMPGTDEHRRHHQRFTEWIQAGHSGEMHYLSRANEQGDLLRSAIQTAFPWARSIILCATNYNAQAPRSVDPAPTGTGWIARYAWSGSSPEDGGDSLLPTDYHDIMLRRLQAVERDLQEAFGETEWLQTKCYVDTGPVVERHLAQLAGIGWIGKNACVINQQRGSWMLLGTIVTSLPIRLEATLAPAADRCGSCTRCIDACPTDALVLPYQMDATRCIAYLTIEKKGGIPEPLRAGIGRQIFGCDICQDVCPWNRHAPIGTHPEMQPRAELINPGLADLAAMDNIAFRRAFRGSPVERTGRKRLHRNVAIAMGNSGNPQHLPQLREWSLGPDPTLAEAAEWAIQRIGELSHRRSNEVENGPNSQRSESL